MATPGRERELLREEIAGLDMISVADARLGVAVELNDTFALAVAVPNRIVVSANEEVAICDLEIIGVGEFKFIVVTAIEGEAVIAPPVEATALPAITETVATEGVAI